MIRVKPAQIPEDFDFEKLVRAPGLNALLELVGDPAAPKRPGPRRKALAKTIEELPAKCLPEFWRRCLEPLRECYGHVCGYLGLKIHRTGLATVDHFVPKSRAQRLAYEWSNFRLAAHQVNTEKSEFEDVLDPFLIVNGWFVLDIGSFEVRAAPDLNDQALTEAVDQTIKRLKLNEPTFCQTRAECHDWYHGLGNSIPGTPRQPTNLPWLWEEAPFVAMELIRQGRLREADIQTATPETAPP